MLQVKVTAVSEWYKGKWDTAEREKETGGWERWETNNGSQICQYLKLGAWEERHLFWQPKTQSELFGRCDWLSERRSSVQRIRRFTTLMKLDMKFQSFSILKLSSNSRAKSNWLKKEGVKLEWPKASLTEGVEIPCLRTNRYCLIDRLLRSSSSKVV